MPTGTETIRGVLKLDNFMEGKCFTSWSDFVQAMPSMFSVEVPNDITNVTLGIQQPSDSERDHLWIRTDNSGAFSGLYIYSQGAWQIIYPVPKQLFFMWGDSRNIPAGYTLASVDPNIDSTMLMDMQKIWCVGGTGPTWWKTFHVTYTGV
jgi:hypothetical protein